MLEILCIVQILFIVCKVIGIGNVGSWSWWLVLLPVWIFIVLAGLVFSPETTCWLVAGLVLINSRR